jgi:hypothetical protein
MPRPLQTFTYIDEPSPWTPRMNSGGYCRHLRHLLISDPPETCVLGMHLKINSLRIAVLGLTDMHTWQQYVLLPSVRHQKSLPVRVDAMSPCQVSTRWAVAPVFDKHMSPQNPSMEESQGDTAHFQSLQYREGSGKRLNAIK